MEATRSDSTRRRARAACAACVLLYACGIATFALAPPPPPQQQQAESAAPPWVRPVRTYVDENALLPGSAMPADTYGPQDMANAVPASSEFFAAANGLPSPSRSAQWEGSGANWIAEQLTRHGFETHHFYYDGGAGDLVYGVLRAARGDGRESIALSVRTDTCTKEAPASGAANNVGFLLSIAKHLQRQNWLARDVVFLFNDGPYGVKEWLHNYIYNATVNVGVLHTALCFDVTPEPKSRVITVIPYGLFGKLPNLDIATSFFRVANREGIRYESLSILPPLDSARNGRSWSETLHTVFGNSPTARLLQTLWHFLLSQATGLPTGDHSYFTQYRVDAITVATEGRPTPTNGVTQLAFARVAVSSVRSLNNLLEHLHHACNLYALLDPTLYLSFGKCMICFGMVMAPIAIEFLYYALDALRGRDVSACLRPLAAVAACHFITGLCYITATAALDDASGTREVTAWIVGSAIAAVSVVAILTHFAPRATGEYLQHLRPLCYLVPCVCLASFALVNYGFCIIAAMPLAPLAVLCAPSQPISFGDAPQPKRGQAAIKLLLCSLCSPLGVAAAVAAAAGPAAVQQAVRWGVATQALHGTLHLAFALLVWLPLCLLHAHACLVSLQRG
eukprot:TRINITY_DN46_c1_g3_i1.p1 TRINITY_DN46_c1_g3~~TRINITY_DN46_c1_g3_i1.p1  ORF type:complete len:622 (+),score=145.06 TRINITY_DN46_c1_g3_i1:176-2041(+)